MAQESPLTEEQISNIAQTAAREVVEEELSKTELPFHIAEHQAVGHGLVVYEARAEATPCKVFTYDSTKFGWSAGVIGLISEKRNPEQFAKYCKVCIPATDGVARRFERVKAEVAKAHEEWEREGGGLPEWWQKVGPVLRTD